MDRGHPGEMLRDSMLTAHRRLAPRRPRPRRPNLDLDSDLRHPRSRFLEPAPPWQPSRVTLVGDAANVMLPHPRPGRQPRPSATPATSSTNTVRRRPRGDADLVDAIGAYEQDMRDYVYPFMRMTMQHDRQFGGGALRKPDKETA